MLLKINKLLMILDQLTETSFVFGMSDIPFFEA
jgi:hypothetical protein